MIGLIVPVPKSVAESGYIRIWGDNNGNRTLYNNWELLAYEYDLETKKCKGEYFEVKRKEVESWMCCGKEACDVFGIPERQG